MYVKALQEFCRGHELTASEWELAGLDNGGSHMYPILDRYQQEGYQALLQIARHYGGAFLCDGVGLGKTFVGLMIIERLVMHEGKRVALFVPKSAAEDVWKPALRTYLPHVGGVSAGDFSSLVVFNHSDLGRAGTFPTASIVSGSSLTQSSSTRRIISATPAGLVSTVTDRRDIDYSTI